MPDKTLSAVDIARDVLKMLDSKKVLAEAGVYFDLDAPYPEWSRTPVLSLLRSSKPCHVCAIGGLFSSLVCKTEDPAVGYVDAPEMRQKLTSYFTYEQLALIETAFETAAGFASARDIDRDEIERAIAFGDEYRDDDSRLRAICQNIIDNKGVFKP